MPLDQQKALNAIENLMALNPLELGDVHGLKMTLRKFIRRSIETLERLYEVYTKKEIYNFIEKTYDINLGRYDNFVRIWNQERRNLSPRKMPHKESTAKTTAVHEEEKDTDDSKTSGEIYIKNGHRTFNF